MQRKQAIKLFKEEHAEWIKKASDCDKRCAFLDFVEMLYHGGHITQRQYSEWSWNGGKA